MTQVASPFHVEQSIRVIRFREGTLQRMTGE